jgi:hypothetical protein
MVDGVMASTLENGEEGREVRASVGMGMVDRVADPRLRGEMDHAFGALLLEEGEGAIGVGEVEFMVPIARVVGETGQAGALQRHVVVGIEVIDAHHIVTSLEERECYIRTDEARRSSDQDLHAA